jgi:putative Mg2+ transporter-C (MgtC) family protein
MSDMEITLSLRMVMAVVCGAVIGAEREWHGKPAGLRTNILICLGASIFTMLSVYIASTYKADPARIAAQIVTGIGFIGAGAIIRGEGGVHGLTTAATIWLVAAIGMCCGAGFYILASTATGLTFLVLLGLVPIDKWLARVSHKKTEDENNRNSGSNPLL